MKVLNVNLLGTIDVTLKLLPLIRRAQGRVVNMSSICGRLAFNGGGYCISKYGVESFSDSLRREMASFGVKVCVVEPGYFKTPITNPVVRITNLEKVWEKVPEEIRRSYGQENYEAFHSRYLTRLEKLNPKIHLVTDCIEHALTAVYPQTRYSAGWDAKLFFLPLSYCPTALADFILTKC
ncbi:17-beta-hydroxysteroid dehydrogenase type 6-like [Mixophyes fleayi]|uniref:17-beta-hydroxysteroid dehydrogenase type 6-like n=1 Tax=Mixophyes fleayi TaxID=3061075 RepID=UPI003F4E332A